MTLWARITWQAKEPAALAGELAGRLAVAVRPGGLVPGARLLDLGTALLEVRPWVREGPADDPRTAGRLMLEPVPDGEEPPSATTAAAPRRALVLHAFGWATVDLDRAEDELAMWLGPRAGGEVEDEHLGARARIREGAGLPGDWTALLEPVTEGRAAASLARDGEGPCALYLRPAEGLEAWLAVRDGVPTADAARQGPFGRQVLLPGAPAGPHIVVTEGRRPPSTGPGTGTIAP